MIKLLLAFAVLASAAQKKPSGETGGSQAPMTPEKSLLETYVRERTDRVKEMHQSQTRFISGELEDWNSFWNKMKEDRTRFEVQMARQRLNLIESLESLDPNDHSSSISDFEKLQAKLVNSFESTQKAKIDDFFASRDERSSAFASQTERERQSLVADGEKAWKEQKERLGIRPPTPEEKMKEWRRK